MFYMKPLTYAQFSGIIFGVFLGRDNPVHQNMVNHLWYFWDECWVDLYGPFNTKEEADQACAEYARNL